MFQKVEVSEKRQSELVDREEVIRAIKEFRSQWKEATGGKMRSVTVNLEFLFDDLAAIVRKL